MSKLSFISSGSFFHLLYENYVTKRMMNIWTTEELEEDQRRDEWVACDAR